MEPGILLGPERPDLLRNESLADIFRDTALAYPGKIALIYGEQTITFQQLDAWSNAVAWQLLNLGIGKGKFVAVWYPRGLNLHVAILGIVKSGAAYIPIDSEMPAERVAAIVSEVEASACFTPNTVLLNCPVLKVTPFTTEDHGHHENIISAGDFAYVLYTSGSTGKPKGIPITHRQICHLVRAEQSVLGIKESDKVYQGFSVSFDMWCEETWISYLAGATLFVVDEITAKAIDELSDVLRANNITVLHAVPSLLSIMDTDIATLRLINAGGEACTQQVLDKWATGERLFYNSYGPTETTVTSSMISLKKGDEITIGNPLPNYNYAIADENLNLLPFDELGELIITGPGVGAGYIKLPELTAVKFVRKPNSLTKLPGETIYRTGDNAIIHKDGKVEFHGRIDDQVKLRGYRIELGEIETQLAHLDNVLTASVAVKKDNNYQDQLVGYVVTDKNKFDEQYLRTGLAKVLAPYMVPGIIVRLDEMPRLSSGKINRKALPIPPAYAEVPKNLDQEVLNNNSPLEERLVKTLDIIFPGRKIDLTMDFFTDLGGHSLLAATFVSRLRKYAGVKNASLKDVYLARPLKELLKVWDEKDIEIKETVPFNSIPWWRFTACWVAQTFALVMIFGMFAAQIFFPYLGYYYTQLETESHFYAILVALGLFCLVPPLLTHICVVAKWVVIGRMKEGEYPLWGTYYFRWWFVKTMQNIVPIQFLNGTPLFRSYLKLMGARIGYGAQLSSFTIGAEDLVNIGKDVSISSNVMLNNAVVEKGMLRLSTITIGDHAYIGSSAVIAGGSVIEDWGEIKDLSFLQPGKIVRSREIWQGSPAQFTGNKVALNLPEPRELNAFGRIRYRSLYGFLLLIFPFAVLIPFLPVLATLNILDNAAEDYDFSYLIITPVLSLFYTILFAMLTVYITRNLQKGIKPGVYSVHSRFYVRKWLADQFMALSLMVMHPVYATVYLPAFFRALGAKVGRDTEVSTASNVTHPLLDIGREAFIADGVILGEADVRGQSLILDNISIGDRSFVGNSALIPQGYRLGSDMLIGVLSTPPSQEQLDKQHAKDWFGSPAIALPNRQDSGVFDPSLTVNPSRLRYLARAGVELVRIMIPETILLCASVIFIAYVHDLLVDDPWWHFMLFFPLYYLAFIGIPCFAFTVLLKWVSVGIYKPWQKPMWTARVWISEGITTIYEALAVPFFLEYLKGTPWLPVFLRLLGVRIGKRVWMNTTDITEYDMVSIGDDTALNIDCGPQTHLFEDRIMKVGAITIGERNSIGAGSIILYDSELGNDVQIEPLSLVMKGEKIPEGSKWGGSPIRSVET